jgi:hypothetical protein
MAVEMFIGRTNIRRTYTVRVRRVSVVRRVRRTFAHCWMIRVTSTGARQILRTTEANFIRLVMVFQVFGSSSE